MSQNVLPKAGDAAFAISVEDGARPLEFIGSDISSDPIDYHLPDSEATTSCFFHG